MDIFLQQIINGLVLGSIYALVALGYTMVYGILGLINFAHGEVVMVGALICYSVMTALLPTGLPPVLLALVAVLIAAPACMGLAWAIERYAYRPLRHAPKLAPLISAIGVSILLQNLAMMIWGRSYHAFPDILPAITYDIGGAHLSLLQAVTIALAAITMAVLAWMIQRTSLGQAMRATAENPAIAELMGIPVNRIITLTFVIGAALAALAGLMVGANYSVAHYYMGFMLGLKAFTAAVLGGIGNITGAMLGGLLLGLIESLGAGYIEDLTGGFLGSHYQDIFAFLVLIGVLVFRPGGLMGERVSERA
ncbi:MAG: branched-chain amino acid ABC transporter permease [Fluviibacter sp.]|jgi:branched-chain amino acid transport system permease protein